MAMRKPGAYAPLYANYADDEAIMTAGEDAELMYIRMLAYAARTPLTEGWISDRVIQSRLGILPRAAGDGAGSDAGIEPGTDAGSRAEKLCTVGLIERDGDGFRIVSWLRWNRSVEEMGRERARDSGRKNTPTSTDDGTGTGTRAGNDAGLPHASPLSDQKQIRSNTDQSRATATETIPDGFDTFWDHYPKKADKGHARKAYVAALKKTDAATVTAGALAYATHVKAEKTERKFIANPSTWLNGERWTDDYAPITPTKPEPPSSWGRTYKEGPEDA